MKMKSYILCVLLVGLALTPAAWAQAPAAAPAFNDATALPEGPQGARIRSLLDTVNAGDAARARRFIETECTQEFRDRAPLDDHIARMLGFRRDTGGVEFHAIRAYTPPRPEVVVIVRDRNMASWWGIIVRFGETPEFPVTGFGISPARPPAGQAEPPLAEAEAVAEIRALADRLAASGWLSGSVLVAKGPDVLLTRAAGEADKADHVPNRLDTKFNLGSMNKMFTATAAARLIEQGQLAFDDPIGKYVDETWLPKDVTGQITVRQLMTHTSGLGSYFNETYFRSSRALFRKLDDYKPLVQGEKPAFTPGEQFRYSNTGMFLLGVVIEKVTGEDYFDHIRRVIAAPAGMADTDCYEMDCPVENLAIGYSPDWTGPCGWRNNLYSHVLKGGPAGGGFSTAVDLHRFALAMLADKYVSRAMRDTLWTDYKGSYYGYGYTVAAGPGGRVVGHTGGFDGINSQLDIYVDSGYIVAVMSNVDNGATPLARCIGRILARIEK